MGQYKSPVESFFNSWMPGGGMTYTPCGLAWRDKWGANRYAGNGAFIALVAADSGIQTDKLRKWGAEQITTSSETTGMMVVAIVTRLVMATSSPTTHITGEPLWALIN